MPRRPKQYLHRGRLRAVLSCLMPLLLIGCASSGTTPLGASLQALVPGDTRVGVQAAAIPHATLSARLGDVQGLRVMGAQAGDVSYWPARGGGVLELHNGGLQATAGLPADLLGTHYNSAHGREPWRQDAPAAFSLVRHWRNRQAEVKRGEARGEMQCAEAVAVELPLGRRALERCDATLSWASGETTEAIYWRDPASRRLWAVRETPWPGAPTMQWQVARHWW